MGDEDKKDNDSKKRGFLKSLSVAVSALLSITPFINIPVSKADVLSALKAPNEVSSQKGSSEPDPLIISPSFRIADDVPGHDSHYSHSSHESHYSHTSHYSHYSSSE